MWAPLVPIRLLVRAPRELKPRAYKFVTRWACKGTGYFDILDLYKITAKDFWSPPSTHDLYKSPVLGAAWKTALEP